MSRRPILLAGLLLLGLLLTAFVITRKSQTSPHNGAAPAPPARAEWVLALGDSVSVGLGAADPSRQGYVALVQRQLRAEGERAELTNLAISGETTASMIARGQLDSASQFLRDRRGSPGVVTISIGANDLARLYAVCPFTSTDVCRAAAASAIANTTRSLRSIFQAVRQAAGPEARVLVLSTYNPLVHTGCQLHPFEPLARAVIHGGAPLDLSPSFSAAVSEQARASDATVVNLGGVGEKELTRDCLHLNEAGYALTADEVMRALR